MTLRSTVTGPASRGPRNYIIAVLLFASGAGAGYFAGWERYGHSHASHHHQHIGGYRYTNPLLDCEIAAEEGLHGEIKPFKYKLERLIDEARAAGRADSVSVYFRDLNSGTSFGINSQEQFSPASLMKVPVMMGYLKKAESDPGILKKTMVYDGKEDWNERQNLQPAKTIVPGTPYTVDELIYRMMAYSDNNAWSLLFQSIGPDYLDAILADIHVEYDPARAEDLMTVKSFASLYRVLYNATYLSRQMSEKALDYLAHTDFTAGIVAGVPPGTSVASKFGERTLDGGRTKQLHEFGIVYYQRHPYLLGVMTRGRDFNTLAAVLRDVSRVAYAEVEGHVKIPGEH